MREIVVRRGREFFEWRFRDEPDSKFRTTKIPQYPVCEKPARCKWCQGMQVGPVLLEFPYINNDTRILHVMSPQNGCHLVAMEYCMAHPNEPIRAGWLLTDEERQEGKTGSPWPDDV